MTLSIVNVHVVWTPDRPEFAPGFRGKGRLFPVGTPQDHLEPFARRAGCPDACAQDPRAAVRQGYCMDLFFAMTLRDGLDAHAVHRLLLPIVEYASACAPDIPVALRSVP